MPRKNQAGCGCCCRANCTVVQTSDYSGSGGLPTSSNSTWTYHATGGSSLGPSWTFAEKRRLGGLHVLVEYTPDDPVSYGVTAGDWAIELLDGDGNIILTARFEVIYSPNNSPTNSDVPDWVEYSWSSLNTDQYYTTSSAPSATLYSWDSLTKITVTSTDLSTDEVLYFAHRGTAFSLFYFDDTLMIAPYFTSIPTRTDLNDLTGSELVVRQIDSSKADGSWNRQINTLDVGWSPAALTYGYTASESSQAFHYAAILPVNPQTVCEMCSVRVVSVDSVGCQIDRVGFVNMDSPVVESGGWPRRINSSNVLDDPTDAGCYIAPWGNRAFNNEEHLSLEYKAERSAVLNGTGSFSYISCPTYEASPLVAVSGEQSGEHCYAQNLPDASNTGNYVLEVSVTLDSRQNGSNWEITEELYIRGFVKNRVGFSFSGVQTFTMTRFRVLRQVPSQATAIDLSEDYFETVVLDLDNLSLGAEWTVTGLDAEDEPHDLVITIGKAGTVI